MNYPKQLMSITELHTLGYPREDLKRYTHIKGSPARRTFGGGKWLFDTTKLEDFIRRVSQ